MQKNYCSLALLGCASFITCAYGTDSIIARIDHVNETTKNLTLEIPIDRNDYLYTDYLTIAVDNPHVAVQAWDSVTPLVNHFDPAFSETKRAFNQTATLTMALTAADFAQSTHANLYVSYYLASQSQPIEEVIHLDLQEPLSFNHTQTHIDTQSIDHSASQPQTHARVPAAPAAVRIIESPFNTEHNNQAQPANNEPQPVQTVAKKSWLEWISAAVTQSNSLAMRLLLVFLLGLLMSLTPCIYPMIPITAGILQTQSSKSILASFMLALSYTFGIATTFSILGLLAAFAGQAMGQLMNQPIFILPLVALLIYLALAMIGVYDMYIPRFLQPGDRQVHGGSFVSAFAFGAISGIVASPCLSPGLVCLLCLVTTLGSKLLGFILLFAFGVGLSVPLLVIGTFSSSLSLLPQAGMWMVEVKKIFGYVMLAMCLYFLNYITPWHIMAWIIAGAAFMVGIAFFYEASHAHTKVWRWIYNLLGIALVASSVFLAFKAVQTQWHPQQASHGAWQTNYESARAQAHAESKKLFVDIGAPFCSICKAIDTSLFSDRKLIEFLENSVTLVKIDGSDNANAALMQRFHVIGFPTILLIDPQTQTIIKHWGPELYGTSAPDFIQELQSIL